MNFSIFGFAWLGWALFFAISKDYQSFWGSLIMSQFFFTENRINKGNSK